MTATHKINALQSLGRRPQVTIGQALSRFVRQLARNAMMKS